MPRLSRSSYLRYVRCGRQMKRDANVVPFLKRPNGGRDIVKEDRNGRLLYQQSDKIDVLQCPQLRPIRRAVTAKVVPPVRRDRSIDKTHIVGLMDEKLCTIQDGVWSIEQIYSNEM